MPVDKAQELLGLSFKSLQSGWLMAITLSLISRAVEKLMFFSCRNKLFANYDTGGNEFCTVYVVGIGIRCFFFFPCYLERLSFCWYACILSIGFLMCEITTNNDYTPRVVSALSICGPNKCWLLTVPLMKKKKPLDESERGQWKSWLKAQHSEN